MGQVKFIRKLTTEYHPFAQFFQLLVHLPTNQQSLTPSTANEFTAIDSFHFVEEIYEQDSNFHKASLDVDSLFTNIPLEESINICVGNLCNDNENPPNIPKHDFCNLLNIVTKETSFMFNNKYYKQADGVAMRSPLGPAFYVQF